MCRQRIAFLRDTDEAAYYDALGHMCSYCYDHDGTPDWVKEWHESDMLWDRR